MAIIFRSFQSWGEGKSLGILGIKPPAKMTFKKATVTFQENNCVYYMEPHARDMFLSFSLFLL